MNYICIADHYNPEIDKNFKKGDVIEYMFFRKFIYGDFEFEGKFKQTKNK
jgi:hypothetical protein